MPRDDDRLWQWGKHKGTPLQDLSTNYLQWAVSNFTYDKAVAAAEKELRFRNVDVPTERNVETPEQKMINKIQFELKKTTLQLTNLTEGLNRLLVASNLSSVSLEVVVKSDYDDTKKVYRGKRSEDPHRDAPWGPEEVIDNPINEDTPF